MLGAVNNNPMKCTSDSSPAPVENFYGALVVSLSRSSEKGGAGYCKPYSFNESRAVTLAPPDWGLMFF